MKLVFILAGKSFNNYDFEQLAVHPTKLVGLVNVGHKASISEKTKAQLDEVVFIKDKEKLGPLFLPHIEDLFSYTDKLVSKYKPSHIYIVCPDEGNIVAAAKLRERYSVHGIQPSDAVYLRDKVAMKKKLAQHQLPVPRNTSIDLARLANDFTYYTKIEEMLGRPFVIKPKSAASGFGVHRISSIDVIKELYVNRIFLDTSYEAEELLRGNLYHCDLGIQNSELIFSECALYNTNNLDADSKNALIGSFSLEDGSILKKSIIQLCRKAVKVLGDFNGFYHCEIFVNDDKITFLEIGARLPGAIITLMYNEMYQQNFFNLDFYLQTQEKLQLSLHRQYYAFWYLYFCYQEMVVKKINPHIVDIDWLIKEREPISINDDGYRVLGRCLYKNKDYELVKKYFEDLKQLGDSLLIK